MTLATHRPTDDRVALPLRHVAAVVAGNALEFYDFLTYSFFAVQICLFPLAQSPIESAAITGDFRSGILDPYLSIGTAAPMLVVGWRLLQGFALGGEVGPTAAFLVEAAP